MSAHDNDDGFGRDQFGNRINEDGNRVDGDGRPVDSGGDPINQDGQRVDDDGRPMEEEESGLLGGGVIPPIPPMMGR